MIPVARPFGTRVTVSHLSVLDCILRVSLWATSVAYATNGHTHPY